MEYTFRVRSSHSIDDTQGKVSKWADNARHVYESVDYAHEGDGHKVGQDSFEMTDETYTQQAQLRQQGLDQARALGVDYLLVS